MMESSFSKSAVANEVRCLNVMWLKRLITEASALMEDEV